jgi:hypothetical protein
MMINNTEEKFRRVRWIQTTGAGAVVETTLLGFWGPQESIINTEEDA